MTTTTPTRRPRTACGGDLCRNRARVGRDLCGVCQEFRNAAAAGVLPGRVAEMREDSTRAEQARAGRGPSAAINRALDGLGAEFAAQGATDVQVRHLDACSSDKGCDRPAMRGRLLCVVCILNP